MGRLNHRILWLAFVCATGFSAGAHTENLTGPVEARILRVLDGDTFEAEARVWPGHSVRVNVRIRGIDAPEIKSRCGAERRAALEARAALSELLGERVSLWNIGSAKYYGRVLADVETAEGTPVVPFMLSRGLARPYEGGRRAGWCG